MRKRININTGWSFIKDDVGLENAFASAGEKIEIPHTWNGTDGQSGGNNYYRGTCWYMRRFAVDNAEPGDRVYLEFKGVNASAAVYLNGKEIGTHDGGYSTFRFDITDSLNEQNTLAVSVDNGKNERVYPQTADFTFYGGIYRDVNIVTVPENHFSLTDNGSSGVKATPAVKEGTGILTVETVIHGMGIVKNTLLDAKKQEVASAEGNNRITLPGVHLWDGLKDPYLYTLKTQLIVNGQVSDELKTKIGFRTFSVDPQEGFILNGKKYPLRGVCRHQDRPGLGNALTMTHHEQDIALIREVGATTIRLAHYQHDDYFYDLCDKYGFIVWAEIPYISRHMKRGNENAKSQMTELIKQQYNHPSIVCWGLSNEITMFPAGPSRLNFHRELNDYCHAMDPTRETAIACYVTKANANRLNRVPDLVSYNLYYGWYFPFTVINAIKLDLYHKFYPYERIGLAEYGAEAMPNLHSARPHRGDNTEEYQALYHEKLLKIINDRDYLWATHVWNMFDFAADARNQGGEPGMNHKGLITFDRSTRKDSFFLYKAYWSDEPFVHICGKRFEKRKGKSTKVKFYSNQKSIDLYVNGSFFKTLEGDRIFSCTIPLTDVTDIRIQSGDLSDEARLIKVNRNEPSYRMRRTGRTKSWQK